MTTEEFISAAKDSATPDYWAISALANINEDLMIEVENAINTIRTARNEGLSLVDLETSSPAQDDAHEITAAVDVILSDKVLQTAITAYHKQLLREDVISIIKGVSALAKQPGSCYNCPGLVDALPFYSVLCSQFIEDWNNAHPEEEPIP